MPRGKKYTAAEKHFLEQKAKLDKEAVQLRSRNKELSLEVAKLKRDLADYEKCKKDLADALKLLEMSPAEFRRHQQHVQSIGLMTTLLKASGGLY